MEMISEYTFPYFSRIIASTLHISSTVWTFYFGLVSFHFQDELKNLQKILDRGYDKEAYLHFAFESQQQVVSNEIVKRLHGQFRFYNTLTSSDVSAIDYTISTTSEKIVEIKLPCCNKDGDDRITSLLQTIQRQDLHNLQTLVI